MKVRIFNKYLAVTVIVLILISGAITLHSMFTSPTIVDWNYQQLGKINKEQNTFSFAVFGDNKNSVTTFDNLIKRVNQEDAAFAFDIGDLVYDGDLAKFKFFIKQMKKINKPFLTAIGNHELKEEGRANYYDLFGRFYYSFVIGNSYFIVLDDANTKNIDPWQLNWLKNELRKSQTYKNRFVFMHVPLYDPRKGHGFFAHGLKDKKAAKDLNDLFDEYKVTMIFASHIHAYFRGVWGKTPYIITGGAGAELFGTDPEHYFYHYIMVKVGDAGVDYEVIKLKSPGFELLDRLTHDLWLYIYAYIAIHFWTVVLVLSLIYLVLYIIMTKKGRLPWKIVKTHDKGGKP